MHVHFVGIGGSGLSAIAKILLEGGYIVSGSDYSLSPLAISLQSLGAKVFPSHHADNVIGADLVIRSSAVHDDNPEVQSAKRLGIPILKRSEFLKTLLTDKICLAVAGTHGKTTTTAMLAWTLSYLGQDPSFIIGGVSLNLGSNGHLGTGPFFVIEADEYDRMFLGLRPQIAVVTSIEHDHPDLYPTPKDYYQLFREFLDCILPGGVLIGCADEPEVVHLIQDASLKNIQIKPYSLSNSRIKLNLKVPGIHNVRNALACITVCEELGLPLDRVKQALELFEGTNRRFEIRGEAAGVTVIDDYAHHPTEIRATLSAARSLYDQRRLWVVWQPHTYSRTRQLFNEFATAFEDADIVVVTEVYAAREEAPVDGFSARKIVEAIAVQKPGKVYFQEGLKQAQEFILERLVPGDVLMVLSAGDANLISSGILQALIASKSGDKRVVR